MADEQLTTHSETGNILSKRQDETDLQHHKRLIFGKLIDKTLSDYDYTELSKYAYGKAYATDVARRLFYGSCKTLQLIDDETIKAIEESDIINEIEQKKKELLKERKKFYDQRREYNKLITVEAREEYLHDSIINAANNVGNIIGNLYSDAPTDVIFDDTEAVLVFSDWHYGMKTDNIFNKYDTEICVQRVAKTVSEAKKRIQLHNCKKLNIIVLGDLYHGAIHVSARVASEELVCDQLMQVSEILAQSIVELSNIVEETSVFMTYGNHARTVPNKLDNIHKDNMERIIPWWLEARLKDCKNIKIEEPTGNEFILADVYSFNYCASHGDLDSVKNSPRLLQTLFQKTMGKDIDCIILGDKHHRESFNELGIDSILCGSLCGSDDYANDKRLFSTPSQLLLIVRKGYGTDAEYHLKCN